MAVAAAEISMRSALRKNCARRTRVPIRRSSSNWWPRIMCPRQRNFSKRCGREGEGKGYRLRKKEKDEESESEKKERKKENEHQNEREKEKGMEGRKRKRREGERNTCSHFLTSFSFSPSFSLSLSLIFSIAHHYDCPRVWIPTTTTKIPARRRWPWPPQTILSTWPSP